MTRLYHSGKQILVDFTSGTVINESKGQKMDGNRLWCGNSGTTRMQKLESALSDDTSQHFKQYCWM